MKPLVSIAIPTLNRCSFLRLSLESALKQTYTELEIIVSDNASTDETAKVLGEFTDHRVVKLRQPSTVPVFEHWDKCLNAARGEYFLVLSDDDLLHPNAIQRMVDVFQQARSRGHMLAFAGCRTTVIDAAGTVKYHGAQVPRESSAEDTILEFFRSTIELVPCAMLFHRASILNGYSRFARQFYLGADAALWIEIIANEGRAGFANEELAMYRVHANTTAKTPLTDWYFENLELSEFAIAKLAEHGHGDLRLYQQIRTAAHQLNTRITASFLAAQWKTSKGNAMKTARQHAGQLASVYGVLTAAKYAIVALLPGSLRPRLIALRRRLREKPLAS